MFGLNKLFSSNEKKEEISAVRSKEVAESFKNALTDEHTVSIQITHTDKRPSEAQLSGLTPEEIVTLYLLSKKRNSIMEKELATFKEYNAQVHEFVAEQQKHGLGETEASEMIEKSDALYEEREKTFKYFSNAVKKLEKVASLVSDYSSEKIKSEDEDPWTL